MDSMDSINTIGLVNQTRDSKETTDTDDTCVRQADQEDGGYGWVIVICSFFVYSVISFNVLAYGIFISYFRDTFGWSESELGIIASLRLGLLTLAGDLYIH